MKPIGIYVDHHGEGHRSRAIAIAQQAPDHFTLLGTGLNGKSAALSILDLPDDCSQSVQQGLENDNTAGIRRRTRLITDWIETVEPALLLIDVSLEIATLARLTSTPTAYVRLAGKRNDQSHLEAFNTAEAILCPYHRVLESENTPQWLRERSHYFPGLTQAITPDHKQDRKLLIMRGKGHNALSTSRLLSIAHALPDWRIDVIGGHQSEGAQVENLYFHNWIENPASFIGESSVVLGGANDGLISAVSSAGKPFVCIPQADPFDEQYEKAARLEALNAAVVCWQWPQDWQKTIASALQRGSVMAALHDDKGAARAAEFLLNIAYGTKRSTAFWFVQANPMRFANR